MGLGIAYILASAGLNTLLYDIDKKTLSSAIDRIKGLIDGALKRGKTDESTAEKTISLITPVEDFGLLKGQLIIEAVVEQEKLKKDIFKKLAAQNEAQTILVSNTSSIPISSISVGISNPERIAGLHFFNPVHIMKLVEVIATSQTSEQTIKTLQVLVRYIGKIPVLAKDSPGFIVNRVARQYYLESLKIMEEGIADFGTIDKLMEASGYKMGPFRLMDLIGIDSNHFTTQSMYESFGKLPRFKPSELQQKMVDEGLLGRKSGKGFYDYQ